MTRPLAIDDVRNEALALLEHLASRYGVAMLEGVVDILTGAPGAGMVIEDVTSLVADVVQDIIRRLGHDATRAALREAYAAANAAGDAAEAAKFGPAT